MKVMLINPPIRVYEPPYNFPIGLGYIATSLKENNHEVKVLDVNGTRVSIEEVKNYLENEDYDIVGISGIITQLSYIQKLCKIIKNKYPNKKIIIGGPITLMSEMVLKNTEADITIIKEGEKTLPKLLDNLENLKNVKSIYYKEGNKIIKTLEGNFIENLDELNHPSWDLFPVKEYIKYIGTFAGKINSGAKKSMNVLASRGCPYGCKYCYHTLGRKIRIRDSQSVIDEIKLLKEKYKIQYIDFTDDNFTVNREWVKEICKKMIEQKLKIKWAISSRVDTIDEDLLKLMKRAGCDCITYGIESGSQTILDEMNKGVTVKQEEEAIKNTHKAKIFAVANLLMGMPSETPETIRETIDFAKRTNPLITGIHLLTPLPRTSVYDYALKEGRISNEEEYLKKLGDEWQNVGMFRNININLTKMSDEQLQDLKIKAEIEIKKYYLKAHRITTSSLYKFYKTWKVYSLGFAINRAISRLKSKKRYWEVDKENYGRLN